MFLDKQRIKIVTKRLMKELMKNVLQDEGAKYMKQKNQLTIA